MKTVRWLLPCVLITLMASGVGHAALADPGANDEPGPAPVAGADHAGAVPPTRRDTPLDDDAHSGTDADDACTPGTPPHLTLPLDDPIEGSVLPLLDFVDVYALYLDPEEVIAVSVTTAPGLPHPGTGNFHTVEVLDVACAPVPVAKTPSGVRFQSGPGGLFHAVVTPRFPPQIGPTVEADALATNGPAPEAQRTMCHPPCTFYGYRTEAHRE